MDILIFGIEDRNKLFCTPVLCTTLYTGSKQYLSLIICYYLGYHCFFSKYLLQHYNIIQQASIVAVMEPKVEGYKDHFA